MCIIAAKPAGVPMPDEATLRHMWDNNPDGAGYMYPVSLKKHGKKVAKVQIEKGFMTYDRLAASLSKLAATTDLTALPMVLHFRITTHGGTCPELTHPFPVTSSIGALKKPRSTAAVGVAHNGIISSVSPRKGLSDTAEYVATQLAPLSQALPDFVHNPHALTLVKNAIGSKMAFLTAAGKIVTVGDFVADGGLLYSNTSYQPYQFRYAGSTMGGWDYAGCGYGAAPWDDSIPRKLMPLSGIPGAFLLMSNGDMCSLDYEDAYAMDCFHRVYEYDSLLDVYVQLPSQTQVYTATGMTPQFSDKNATWEDTMTEDAALEVYESLDTCESRETDPDPA